MCAALTKSWHEMSECCNSSSITLRFPTSGHVTTFMSHSVTYLHLSDFYNMLPLLDRSVYMCIIICVFVTSKFRERMGVVETLSYSHTTD